MITSASIYKHETKGWTVEARGQRALLSIMTNNVFHLVDGSTVGRWYYDSWDQAREFVFGPLTKKEES